MEFGSILSQSFNHSHNLFSSHNLFPFSISGGKVNAVGITATPTMFFMVRGFVGTAYVWNVPNITQVNTSYLATNGASNNWATRSFTTDSHLHIYPSTNQLFFRYSAFGNFPDGSFINSSTTSEVIDIASLFSSPPIITNPINYTEQNTSILNITYLNATPNGLIVNISYYNISLRNSDFSFNRTIVGNNSLKNYYEYNVYNANLSIGEYFVRVCAYDTLGFISCDSETFNLTRNGLWNVSVKDYLGVVVDVSSISLGSTIVNSSNGYSEFNIVRNTSYSQIVDNSLYALDNRSIISNTSAYGSSIVFLYPDRSINFTLRDEGSNALVTQNVSLLLSLIGSSTQYAFYTTSGNIFTDTILMGNYTATFSSPSPIAYNVKSYSIDVVPRSFDDVIIFLNTGGSVLLNFKELGGAPISNVLCVQYRIINSSFTIVESRFTDITGRTQFTYSSNVLYQFDCTKDSYNNVSFQLNPILFTSYDVTMSRLSLINITPSAIVSFTPSSFYKGQVNNFSFLITSPFNSLVYYNYSLTYKNFVLSNVGVLAGGEPFTNFFNVSNASVGDTIILDYYYLLDNGMNYSLSTSFVVSVPLYNRTFVSMGNDFYGFELGDRILIVTIITIICFGVGFLAGGTLLGLVLAVVNMLIFSINGFIPPTMLYIIGVVSILIFFGRGSDNG
jgi:hypothetical protein